MKTNFLLQFLRLSLLSCISSYIKYKQVDLNEYYLFPKSTQIDEDSYIAPPATLKSDTPRKNGGRTSSIPSENIPSII